MESWKSEVSCSTSASALRSDAVRISRTSVHHGVPPPADGCPRLALGTAVRGAAEVRGAATDA